MTAFDVLTDTDPDFHQRLAELGAAAELASEAVRQDLQKLYDDVRERGATAVVDATERFDGVTVREPLVIADDVVNSRAAQVSPELAASLQASMEAHRQVNEAFLAPAAQVSVGDGITTRLERRPVSSTCLYVPGGQERYPSTLAGLAVAAKVAGVAHITAVLPPEDDGLPDPAACWIARSAGIEHLIAANGPTTLAAIALGAPTLPAAELIVGPGGPHVVAAQQLAGLQGIGVGPQFGPTDCTVLADDTADPALLAADLLTESEHGHAPRLVLITWQASVAEAFAAEMAADEEAATIWRRCGTTVLCRDQAAAVRTANTLGGEQIQLAVSAERAEELLPAITAFSAIQVGQPTGISAAYMTGAPGCLPTGRSARSHSAVTAETFRRTVVISRIGAPAQERLARLIDPLAAYEGFPRHAHSQRLRVPAAAAPSDK
ncbi:histidinol dehydrogenase [Streptomyces sp. NBC_01166]|uniref:histidinol dehydrogenase n=1 Tax=Streptomyces sp. NBC_01166 TaxID=2903755 RepID=UPI00386D4002|nr:histidinol dehydrogenase [Streptomyces sp. NBC_01166]